MTRRTVSCHVWRGSIQEQVACLMIVGFILTVSPTSVFARKWTDSTGTHTVEAEFLGITDGNVRLKKEDGTVLNVPLEKLSTADRAFAEARSEGGGASEAPGKLSQEDRAAPAVSISLTATTTPTIGQIKFNPVDFDLWIIRLTVNNKDTTAYRLEGEAAVYTQASDGQDWGGSGSSSPQLPRGDKDVLDTKFRLACGQFFTFTEGGRIEKLIYGSQCINFDANVPMGRKFSWPAAIAASEETIVEIKLAKPWIPPGQGSTFMATPRFVPVAGRAAPFRYWLALPSAPPCKTNSASGKVRLVPMDADKLLNIAASGDSPMILRRTCLAWLADVAPIPDRAPLVRIVRDDKAPMPVRQAAARALAWGAPPKGEDSLAELVADAGTSKDLRLHCVYGLELLGTASAKKVLASVARQDADDEVRKAATKAIEPKK